MKVKDMTLMALLVAIGVVSASVVAIPVGSAKAMPVQGALNVISAVLLGPIEAGIVALLVAVLRISLGTGTIMAIPGSIIGALLAGYLYRRWPKIPVAMAGELFGTGVIAGLLAVPIAKYVLGKSVAAFFYVILFALSSGAGVILAGLLLPVLQPVYNRGFRSLPAKR